MTRAIDAVAVVVVVAVVWLFSSIHSASRTQRAPQQTEKPRDSESEDEVVALVGDGGVDAVEAKDEGDESEVMTTGGDGDEATSVGDESDEPLDDTRAFDFDDLEQRLKAADESVAMEIFRSHLNDSQLTAATKEAITEKVLEVACTGGLERVVRQLLDAGRDPNRPINKDGWTPLYRVSSYGHTEIVKLLLEAHADVNAANKDGCTPLVSASSYGSPEIVKLLLEARADVNMANKAGDTPLHRATKSTVAQYLLAAGANQNALNEDGWSPLHRACLRHLHGIAAVLLASGSRRNTADKDGYQAIHLALFCVWRGGCSVDALRTLQVLVENRIEWDSTCDKFADRAARWPASMGNKPRKTNTEQWQREAPAIRVCFERWTQEHKQGLPLTDVPVEQVRNGADATEIFLREIAESRDVKFRRKICIVGPSNWGKTSLVKSLTTETPSLVHPDDRTIGIDHFHLAFEEQVEHLKATKKHEVTFWDFAGQDAYQVAHSLFFSDRTVYIVCIDLESHVTARMQAELMTDTESETDRWMNEFIDTRVLRWIRVICARQQDAEFVFVATKKDRVTNANLDGEVSALADLRMRMENVAVIIDEMKHELDKKTLAQQQSATETLTAARRLLPITHLGDERLERMAEKPSVRILVTSCMTKTDVKAFKSEIQDVIMKSDRSFPMPDKFSLVLEALLRMRAEAVASATDKRIASTFRAVEDLIQELVNSISKLIPDGAQEQSASRELHAGEENSEDAGLESGGSDDEDSEDVGPYLDAHTCRTILQTLRDLGDVLWYDTIDDELLKNKIILDPNLMIDLVRDVFDHNHTCEVMSHHNLKGLKYWRHLEATKSMLSMKRVLQYFQLVYPTTGVMTFDSDLIVPAYWKTNTCAFWMFGGGDLRFGRGVHREDVAVRVHFEFQFVNNYPDTLYDHVVVASYSPFLKREVGPDWIMYKNEELYACRLMVGRDQETHHPTLHLEALQGHSASKKHVDHLWNCFTRLSKSLEEVIRRYPGVVVSRYVREDTEEDITIPMRYTFETLAQHELAGQAHEWMPPQQTWEACLEFCKK